MLQNNISTLKKLGYIECQLKKPEFETFYFCSMFKNSENRPVVVELNFNVNNTVIYSIFTS